MDSIVPKGKGIVARYIDRPFGLQQILLSFPNNWQASVIHGFGSFGLELGVMRNGELHFDNPVSRGDVRGYLEKDELIELLEQINSWPDDVAAVEAMPYYELEDGDDE